MSFAGIKFFEPSMNLQVNGASISATSGDASSAYAIDRNPFTYWRSVSSTDLTTETIEIDFASSMTINRLLCLDINWKQFTIKYDLSGAWTDFTSVVGMDGALVGGISETTFADDTVYYEFASVTTTKIQINILKSQVVNAQKYVAQIIATLEIGTLQGFPQVSSSMHTRNARSQQALSGKYVIQKSDESATYKINFSNYVSNQSAYSADFDLLMTLFDRDLPFIVWVCGGRRGSKYFGYTLRGFRLKDAYTMQLAGDYDLSYSQGVYKLSVNNSIVLQEHI